MFSAVVLVILAIPVLLESPSQEGVPPVLSVEATIAKLDICGGLEADPAEEIVLSFELTVGLRLINRGKENLIMLRGPLDLSSVVVADTAEAGRAGRILRIQPTGGILVEEVGQHEAPVLGKRPDNRFVVLKPDGSLETTATAWLTAHVDPEMAIPATFQLGRTYGLSFALDLWPFGARRDDDPESIRPRWRRVGLLVSGFPRTAFLDLALPTLDQVKACPRPPSSEATDVEKR